ncbi:hypothetical protein GJ496_000920 [Pomphorhynchus laevis]|nr:hypothetical protein GJ496_000920 [Pomphorhynchus laevis]
MACSICAVHCDDAHNAVLRWATILNQYDYDLEYVTGNDNYIADALSRLPSARKIEKEAGENSEEESLINMIQSETMDVTGMSSERLKDETYKDCILKLVRRYVNTQWPLVIESKNQTLLCTASYDRSGSRNFADGG